MKVYLVNVISPSLSPITESCFEKDRSAGKKNKILSSSCPSCCPLLKSNMHNCMASLEVAADDKPIFLFNVWRCKIEEQLKKKQITVKN